MDSRFIKHRQINEAPLDGSKMDASLGLKTKVMEYLASHHVMTLITQGPAGVWGAAVFYVNHGFDLYYLSLPASRHCMNIDHNPSAAATIQEDYFDWQQIRGIQLEGQVCRIRGAEQVEAVRRYGIKFPLIRELGSAPQEILVAFKRVAWYRFVPSRLYYIDNSLGFGHRDEINLESM